MGIIVSCMPILPAFYRHFRGKARGSDRSKSGDLTKGLSASILKRNSGNSKIKAKDPYHVYSTKGYEEIDAANLKRHTDAHGEFRGIVKDVEMCVISERGPPEASTRAS